MTTPAQEPPPAVPPAALLELSIIVPAYDEEHRIGPTLEEYAAHFTPLYGDGFEIVVVLNGCRDDTRGVVESVARDAPQARLIEFVRPMGKGGAIWEGFATAGGRRLAFVDADFKAIGKPVTGKFNLEEEKIPVEGIPLALEAVMNFQNLHLPKAGAYEFVVKVDGRHLGSVPLYAIKVNQPAP